MIGSWIASASPGNEQRSRWGSAGADQQASFNLAGVKSPAVDAMIAALLAARTQEDFVTAVRAYDRVLLSGFYIVPLFHSLRPVDRSLGRSLARRTTFRPTEPPSARRSTHGGGRCHDA